MKPLEGSADTLVRFKQPRGFVARIQPGGRECPPSSRREAQGASVLQPRVHRTLGLRRSHPLIAMNPHGVPSVPGGSHA